MMSMFLLLASQTLSAPEPAPAAPPKTSPSIYALVFVEKLADPRRWGRKDQMVYEATWCGHLDARGVVGYDKTVSRLKVVQKQKDAWPWFEKNLRVESLEDTGVLRISFGDGSPAEQVAIVNTVAKTYVRLANDRIRERYEASVAGSSKLCNELKADVARFEAELLKLNGVEPRNKYEGEKIFNLRNELARDIARYKRKIEALEPHIRKEREYLRKPLYILLELAELPPESKK